MKRPIAVRGADQGNERPGRRGEITGLGMAAKQRKWVGRCAEERRERGAIGTG